MGRGSYSGEDLEEVGAGGRVDHLKHGTRVWIRPNRISPVDRKEPIKGLFTWRWGGVGLNNISPLHAILQPHHPAMHFLKIIEWLLSS